MLSRRIRFIVAVLALLGIGLGSPNPVAQAQDDTGRFIPITGTTVKFELSPDGQTLATYEDFIYFQIAETVPGEEDLRIGLVAVGSGETVFIGPFNTPVSDVAFSPDSTVLASAHLDGYIHLWEVSTGAAVERLPAVYGGGRVAFLPDGKTLLSGHGGVAFLLWDIETGFVTNVLSFHPQDYTAFLDLRQSTQILGDLEVSPDGSGLAFGTILGEIWYWDFTGEVQRLVKDNPSDVPPGDALMPRFLADGRTLTYWDRSTDSLHFAQIPSGLEYTELPIEGGQRRTFTFAPDGETFAWADRDVVFVGKLSMDTREFTVTGEYPIPLADGLSGSIQQLAFSPDSSQIIVGGFRAEVRTDNRLYIIDLPE